MTTWRLCFRLESMRQSANCRRNGKISRTITIRGRCGTFTRRSTEWISFPWFRWKGLGIQRRTFWGCTASSHRGHGGCFSVWWWSCIYCWSFGVRWQQRSCRVDTIWSRWRLNGYASCLRVSIWCYFTLCSLNGRFVALWWWVEVPWSAMVC